ncbi:MAG: carbon-nitrogen hydrolase family protein [Candidatus Brocadiae bacterium]|nr:carbon-nitrogen hydrolase family protein [Candidatus Brocadiia bacterium]
MANYVKISTVGARPLDVDPGLEPQRVVDAMIKHWQGRLDQVLPDRPDLIVVPEACDRPANYPVDKLADYYRTRKDQVLDFFARVAREHRCNIAYCASREIEEDGSWRNSIRIIDRSGEVIGTYNKNHLVIGECEDGGRLYGREAPIVECDFGRVACAICFDLNFDELRLKYVKASPDLIVFCSMYHGALMQAYWAYSCRCHFVGAIAGPPSAIISPVGQVIASSTNYFDFVTAAVNLDCRVVHLDENGARLRGAKDKYGPKVRITDPGFLGAVLISSETEEVSVRDMVAQFEIELLDHYFERSLAHRHAPGHIEP